MKQVVIWALLACTQAPPPEPGAEARFREAVQLAMTDADAGARACLALPDPERQGACLNDVMALTGHYAAEHCRGLPEGSMWREECLFTVSEQLPGDSALRLQLCEETGRFEGHCLHHTWSEEVLLLVEADGLLVDKMDRLAALRVRWTARFSAYDSDPGGLVDDWFWFRYHQHRDTVSTGVCEPLEAAERQRCEQSTLAAVRRLLHDRSRGSASLRPACRPGASLASVELMPERPRVGDDPAVQAQARAWLARWCSVNDRGLRDWIPDFDPQSDANGGPVAGTIQHHDRRRR